MICVIIECQPCSTSSEPDNADLLREGNPTMHKKDICLPRNQLTNASWSFGFDRSVLNTKELNLEVEEFLLSAD